MFDEDVPVKKSPAITRNLESLSIDELEYYITQLTEEIARTNKEIDRKKAHMASAASLFKS